MELAVGDVVLLKSGSDKMTVEAVNATHATCTWMMASGVVREAFDKRMLEK